MSMLLRSMSPQVVITDEISTNEDGAAILKLMHSGVKIICTVHGYSENDLINSEAFGNLIRHVLVEKMVVLSARNGPGTIEKIIDTKEYFNG
jgi:stage III sporulation protein AA